MTHTSSLQQLELPAGYTMRPATLADVAAVVTIYNATMEFIGRPTRDSAEEHLNRWQSPNMLDVATSVQIVEDQTGAIVAYAELWDGDNPPIQPMLIWSVLPHLMDTSIPHVLMHWLEDRAYRVLERCPAEAQIVFRMASYAELEARIRMLQDASYEHVRNFNRMVIHMEQAPPPPQFPTSIQIHTYQHPDDLAAIIAANNEGFRDHWGFIEHPADEEYEAWQHWITSTSYFDPALWFIARDTQQHKIAGLCLCFIQQDDDPAVAYVDIVSVVPAYRKQGIATGLLHHAFGEFWRRGRKSVALHVDASNLTGATRLYEKAGMHTDQLNLLFEKIVREGETLRTTHLES